MGHYIAAKQKNLNVGLPIFIPFVGAWIELKEEPINAEVEAYVAYAGPAVGTLASFMVYFYGRHINDQLYIAIAQSGFILNLFNLIPIHPLDGGRISSIISPRLWFLGVPLLIALYFYKPSPLLIMIAISSYPKLIEAWNYNAKNSANQDYYNIKSSSRFEYGVLYIGLIIILSLMAYNLSLELNA